jgi:hypothetical protein
LVGFVTKTSPEPRSALDRDFDLQLFDQSGDTIWRKRDALLARSGFRWYADFH